MRMMNEFNSNDFEELDEEFDERSSDEIYEDFLESVQKPNDEFIYFYGAFYNAMTKLTGAALNLLTWLTFHCEVNTGRVLVQSMQQRDAIKDLGITTGTYYKALTLLKENGIIKGSKAKYYINPTYAWKGTAGMRAKFLKVYYKL